MLFVSGQISEKHGEMNVLMWTGRSLNNRGEREIEKRGSLRTKGREKRRGMREMLVVSVLTGCR